MNRRLMKKLNNEKGASIIIALFLLMLCTVIGAIILTAATANFGKNINVDEREQAYLDVRSAVWMMRDICLGSFFMKIDQSILTVTVKNEGDMTVSKETDMQGPFYYMVDTDLDQTEKDTAIPVATVDELLKEMAWKINNNNALAPFTEVLELSSNDDFNKVIVSITMSANYNITMKFNRENGVNYPMTLTLGAAVATPDPVKYEKEEFDGVTRITTTITSVCSKIEWKSYQITKGAASA